VFGNNPRILRSSNVRGDLEALVQAVKSKDLNNYVNSISSLNDTEHKSIDGIIHRIFFMRPKSNLLSYDIIFASDYLLCVIGRHLDYIASTKASSLYYNATHPILKGIYFETYFHTYILKTAKDCIVNLKRKYNYTFVKDKNDFQLENNFLERECIFEVSKYNRIDEIVHSDLRDNEYYCPRAFNFSTFDSVFRGTVRERSTNKKVIFFFQCTIHDKHEIKGKNYSTIQKSLDLQGISEVSIIFIVPDTQLQFTPQCEDFNERINVYLGSFPMIKN
jgi:hypothetical protein